MLKKHLNKYHQLDARDINTILSPSCVDVIITSPPYGKMKNYGVSSQIGFGQTHDQYLNDLKKVFSHSYDALKDTGSIWIICDTYKIKGETVSLPFEITSIMKDIGWRLQDIIIWDKIKTIPYSRKGQMRNVFEYILFFSKSTHFKYYIDRIKESDNLKKWWVKYPERYNPNGKNPSNIWPFTIPTQGIWGNGKIEHFCPFPPKLIERIIHLTTNKSDIVMDPFAGSGVVLAQAKVMNRRFIGFDINKDFIVKFKNNVSKEIEMQWKIRNIEVEDKKKQQQYLKKTITKLRKMKYAKVLVQKLQKEDNEIIDRVFVLDKGYEKNISKIDIQIILKENNTELINKINSIVNRKPFSKFEVISKIQTRKSRRNPTNDKRKKYWLYSGGKFWKYNKQIYQSELFDDHNSIFTNGYPPIISDIKINLEIPKN